MQSRDLAAEVVQWATEDENVRIVILNGSRADPGGEVDALSDYDMQVYVLDVEPFKDSEQWLDRFGKTMVREPYNSSTWPDDGHVGPMVMFTDGSRMDIGIREMAGLKDDIRTGDLDSVNRVLLDKDGVTEGVEALHGGDYSSFWTQKPRKQDYDELVHTFWWDITYVAKCLYRNQLFFAKYMLDGELHHHYLSTMLAWYIGVRAKWRTNPGAHGKHFKKLVCPALWTDIEATFAGADLEENWRAMFRIGELFGRLALDVGEKLGFEYPMEKQERVIAYIENVRRLNGRAD